MTIEFKLFARFSDSIYVYPAKETLEGATALWDLEEFKTGLLPHIEEVKYENDTSTFLAVHVLKDDGTWYRAKISNPIPIHCPAPLKD